MTLLRGKTAASVTLALSQCYNNNMRSRQIPQCKFFKVLLCAKKLGNCRDLPCACRVKHPTMFFSRAYRNQGQSQIASSAVMQPKLIDSPCIEDRALLTNFYSRGMSHITTVTSLTPLGCLPQSHCRARLLCSRCAWTFLSHTNFTPVHERTYALLILRNA